jgi:formate dehydrogenase major subunit
MIRESIDEPWREVSWDEALAFTARSFRASGQYGRDSPGRHHLQPLHQRRDLPGAEAGPRRLRQQQCRYLRPRLPFADRLWPQETFGTSAGTQDFDSSSKPTSSW